MFALGETNLEENHGRDLLSGEGLLLAEVLNLDLGLTGIIDDGERPRLDILLDGRVIEAATDETPNKILVSLLFATKAVAICGLLSIEDGVLGVHGSVVLGSLTNQTLLIGEGNERRGGERTLLVGNDLDIVALVDGNARVGSTCSSERDNG